MDIKNFINNINTKISSLSYFDTKVYTDEPIVRTAAQINGFLPEQYKKMKRLATDSNSVKKSEPQIFYEQAKMMEEFTDDYSCNDEFRCFFPTYSSMNDKQLRAYFSWRTGVRRGVAEETSISYVYVYLYELLMLIGTKGPEHAFKKIYNFYKAYRTIDVRLDAYVPLWLKDMVIFYNLDRKLLEGIYDDGIEQAVMTVIANRSDDGTLFSALKLLSAYKLDSSSFYKQNISDFTTVTVKVFRGLFEYYEKKRSGGFIEKIFGRKVNCPYHIFASAVFYDNSRFSDFTYNLTPIHTYHCQNGIWSCERYYGNLKNNKEIGNILKYIDFLLREKTNHRHALNGDGINCSNKKLIERIADEFFEEKRRAEIPVVIINTEKLSSIRENADVIKEKLIIEEEEEVAEVIPESEEDGILSCEEKGFLLRLLNKENYFDYLKERNLMLSVLVDSINEKLFDEFSDTVIFCDGDTPEIYEDYIDELKGMFI